MRWPTVIADKQSAVGDQSIEFTDAQGKIKKFAGPAVRKNDNPRLAGRGVPLLGRKDALESCTRNVGFDPPKCDNRVRVTSGDAVTFSIAVTFLIAVTFSIALPSLGL